MRLAGRSILRAVGHLSLYVIIVMSSSAFPVKASGENSKLLEFVTQSGHSGAIYEIAFSPDGVLLATGSSDGNIKLWDVSTGWLIRTLEQGNNVYSVDFCPSGGILASGNVDGYIKIWEVATGRLIRNLGNGEGEVHSAVRQLDLPIDDNYTSPIERGD